MSGYGLQVLGDNSLLQLGADFRNLSFVGSYNGATNAGSGFLYGCSDSNRRVTASALIGFAASDFLAPDQFYFGDTGNPANGFTVTAIGAVQNMAVTIYLFDFKDAAPVGQPGDPMFEIYDASAKLVFSNLVPYLDVPRFTQGVVPAPQNWPADGTRIEWSVAIPSGNYLFVPIKLPRMRRYSGNIEVGGISRDVYREGRVYVRVTSNSVDFRLEFTTIDVAGGTYPGDDESLSYTYMIARNNFAI